MLIPVIKNVNDLFIDSAQVAIPWNSILGKPQIITALGNLANAPGALVNDGSGNLAWASIGGGTVLSVGLSAPPQFTVTGSPVTGSGTLAFSWASGYQAFTTSEASKLAGIQAGATVGANWLTNLTSIPTIVGAFGGLANADGVLRNDGFGNLSWTATGSGSGTVTLVDTGDGTTGGPITSTGTVSVDQNFDFNWTGAHRFGGPFNVGYPGVDNATALVNTVATTYQAGINQLTDSTFVQLLLRKHDSTASHAPSLLFARARETGTDSVVDGDVLGVTYYSGWHTDSYYLGSLIHSEVDGTPGAGDMPTRLVFSTSANGSATPTERFGINAVGAISFAAEDYGTAGDVLRSGGAGATSAWSAVGGLFANPTGGVNLTGAVGTATTGLRSDAVLILDQGIAPTWTGVHTFSAPSATGIDIERTSGNTVGLRLGQSGIVNWDIQNVASTGAFRITNGGVTPISIDGSAGNVTIAAPSSGTSLSVNAAAGEFGLAVTAAALGVPLYTNDGTRSFYQGFGASAIQLGTAGAYALELVVSGSVKATLAAIGGLTLDAPSSGTSLVINSLSGSPGLAINSIGAAGGLSFGWSIVGGSKYDIYTTSTDALGIGTASAQNLSLYTASANRLVVGSSGTVTINAPSSGISQVINSLSGSPGLAVNSIGAAGGLSFGWSIVGGSKYDIYTTSTDALGIGTASAQNLSLYTASANRLVVGSSGNVTINAPSSGTSLLVNAAAGEFGLDVAAGASNDATISLRGNGSAAADGFQLYQSSVGTGFIWNGDATHGLNFGTNGASRMTISSAGNVTINVPISGVALTVDGSVDIGGEIVFSAITTATGATGGANSLPANPVGFLVLNINGTSRKIPYYAT